VVVKKGEFQVGDQVVYAEIDSVLPDKSEYEFLQPRNFRIKTVRLRGQVSQGICFPMGILPEGEYEIDQDVTEILGVFKYEPPIPPCLEGEIKGMYPSFMPRTDETRIQILQNELTELKGETCSYSEKLEGVSTTFYLKDGDFGVCTRNLDLLEDDQNTLWQMARKYNIEEKMEKLSHNLAFQGETIGDGIQGNYYKLGKNERRFYLFNIFDIDRYEYLPDDEFQALAKELEIENVPIPNNDYVLTDNIDELVKLSNGKSVINPNVKREGIRH
jgi:RNA ligase (TIGR02306 family)